MTKHYRLHWFCPSVKYKSNGIWWRSSILSIMTSSWQTKCHEKNRVHWGIRGESQFYYRNSVKIAWVLAPDIKIIAQCAYPTSAHQGVYSANWAQHWLSSPKQFWAETWSWMSSFCGGLKNEMAQEIALQGIRWNRRDPPSLNVIQTSLIPNLLSRVLGHLLWYLATAGRRRMHGLY